jgi:prolyl oligopeptidase
MLSRIVFLSGLLVVTPGIVATVDLPDDPYIWLEDVRSQRALDWVNAENARTLGILKGDQRYAEFYAEALKISEATDRIPMPHLIGDRVTNFWRDATRPHGQWRATSKTDYRNSAPVWTTLIDLDALSAKDEVNWVWKAPVCEPNAERLCLVALSNSGEDAVSLREFDLAAGDFVTDGFELPTSKQRYAWVDEDTLLVARNWGEGTMTASGYPFVVRELKRGQKLEEAREIFRGAPTDQSPSWPVTLVDGQGHKAILIIRGTTFFASDKFLVTDRGVIELPLPRKSKIAGLVGGKLIIGINESWSPAGMNTIPAGSIVAADLEALETATALSPQLVFAPGPREFVPTGLDFNVSVTRSAVIAPVYDNVRGRGYIFTPNGSNWTASRLRLPENASVGVVSANPHSDDAFVSVTGFLDPTTLWEIDAALATATQVKALSPKFDSSQLVVEQFEATSKDGTKIPYFVVHPKNLPLDGSTPTILTAYGGFNTSLTPDYRGELGKLWLERGGALVVANIRGGGEFGPAWHEAGLKTNRQRIYDDFAAVGEDLFRRKITTPRRLGISGRSNGGLLVAVEMIQRPELWNAVAISVPLLDMLRYEQIGAGASWVDEYGSVSIPEERAFLASISPYANLKTSVAYPEPFIYTTTSDDRVGPSHARKFAARMKEYGLPYLFYEDTSGGHSSDANLKQVAEGEALKAIYFTRKLMDNNEPQ